MSNKLWLGQFDSSRLLSEGYKRCVLFNCLNPPDLIDNREFFNKMTTKTVSWVAVVCEVILEFSCILAPSFSRHSKMF